MSNSGAIMIACVPYQYLVRFSTLQEKQTRDMHKGSIASMVSRCVRNTGE
jgi:hypothetical protein